MNVKQKEIVKFDFHSLLFTAELARQTLKFHTPAVK